MKPTLSQRLAIRAKGVRWPIMYQRWAGLCFFHWRWNPQDIARRLPPGLHVDVHEGAAWLGVVPFFMEHIRPRFLPPVPGISWFQELNVRTYVHDDEGRPGVWFFSLDANQALAVLIARAAFRLPYFHASMSARQVAGWQHYDCLRRGEVEDFAVKYELGHESTLAEPGSLEFFLVERYLLFAQTASGLRVGQVEHPPYQLLPAEWTGQVTAPLLWDSFSLPAGPPDHVIGARPVEVRIGALGR